MTDDMRMFMDWHGAEGGRGHGQDLDADGHPRFQHAVGASGELNAFVPMDWGEYVGGIGMPLGGGMPSHPRWRSAAVQGPSPRRGRHTRTTVGHAPKLRVDERSERPEKQAAPPAGLGVEPTSTSAPIHPREPPEAGRRERVGEWASPPPVPQPPSPSRATSPAAPTAREPPSPSRAASPAAPTARECVGNWADGLALGNFPPLPPKVVPALPTDAQQHSEQGADKGADRSLALAGAPWMPAGMALGAAGVARARQLVGGLGLSPRYGPVADGLGNAKPNPKATRGRGGGMGGDHGGDEEEVHPVWRQAGVAMVSNTARIGYKQWTKGMSTSTTGGRGRRGKNAAAVPLKHAPHLQLPHIRSVHPHQQLRPTEHAVEHHEQQATAYPWVERQVAVDEHTRPWAAEEWLSWRARPVGRESNLLPRGPQQQQQSMQQPMPKRATTLPTVPPHDSHSDNVQARGLKGAQQQEFAGRALAEQQAQRVRMAEAVDVEALLANEIRAAQAELLKPAEAGGPLGAPPLRVAPR